jgi:hypothetical protein
LTAIMSAITTTTGGFAVIHFDGTSIRLDNVDPNDLSNLDFLLV